MKPRHIVRQHLQRKQDRPERLPAVLGDGQGGLFVSGTPNTVYVQVAGGVTGQAWNSRVPASYGLPVWVGYDPLEPDRWQVLSLRAGAAEAAGFDLGGTGYAPASRYRWNYPGGGQDPLFVEGRQFLPLRLGPHTGLSVYVYPWVVWTGTAWAYVPGTAVDLTASVPATEGQARLVLVTIDDSGAVVTTAGTAVALADLGLDDLPSVPAGTRYVVGAVRLYTGQTAVQEGRSNTDILDLRDLPGVWDSGSSTGGGLDEYLSYDADNDQLVSTKPIDMSSQKILNLADPEADQDAATKKYVDDHAGGNTATATNAATPCATPTSDGSGQAIHPSVVCFPSGWNGYKYWMAMTPFPAGDAALENPEILASDDGDTWEVPAGLTNPIDPEPSPHHNADTELLYGQDGVLYCYYIQVEASTVRVMVRSSTDGVSWGGETELFSGTNTNASPTVVWDGAQYRMYYVDYSASPYTLKYRTCATPAGTWSAEIACTVSGTPAGNEIWHIDIHKRGGAWHGFFNLYSGEHPIYFGTSTDGVSWTLGAEELLGAGAAGAWDDGWLYRACAVATDYGYDLWYSGNSDPTNWVVGRTGRTRVYLTDAGGSVYRVETGTGLTGGPITAEGTIALADTAVTPGEYANPTLTVDQQGRITAAVSGTASGGGLHEVVMETGAATPTPIINSDGNDWVYSS
jgi:hypothetical protein